MQEKDCIYVQWKEWSVFSFTGNVRHFTYLHCQSIEYLQEERKVSMLTHATAASLRNISSVETG